MSARRPLLTALGATTLLAVLWFVPSANATAPGQDTARSSGGPAAANTGTVNGVSPGNQATRSGSTRSDTPDSDTPDSAAPDSGNPDSDTTGSDTPGPDTNGSGASDGVSTGDRTSMVTLTLADTGSADTTPYVMGGTLCLGLGAGFVAFSVRRSRTQ
ncbi:MULTISPECIES: hypothetical protein [unclassified Streptomyces]|uniref:hypothetical protein n=1 Tax=unclassified Streptomyces TaxID=2593676 RepID=UPI0029A2A764|nr:hypothetical protein [Streptomyces sp. DK15]MDX2389673.1 hypothetical protein [Streptomyces sp. DK15]